MGMGFAELNKSKWIGVRPGHEGTQVIAFEDAWDGDNTLVYTVPSGKVLFLVAVMANVEGTGDGEWMIRLKTSGDSEIGTVLGGVVKDGHPAPASNITFYPPIELPAGSKIYAETHGDMGMHPTIFGWVV